VALSPDGSRAAVIRNSPETASDVWSIDLARGIAARLTVDRPYCENPVWTPEGRWIWFSFFPGGSRQVARVPGAGGGEPETMLRARGVFDNPVAWSPDGRTLLMRSLSPTTGEDVWAVVGGRDSLWRPVLQSRHHEENPAFSPDGRWLAYRSDESGRPELYIQSYPDPSTRVRVSRDGAGNQVRSPLGRAFWRRDGREIVYVSGDGSSVMSVPVEAANGIQVGTPRTLFRLRPTVSQIVATSDLQRFLAIVNRSSEETASIQFTQDWSSEFKTR
jgi:Tol biopolymer transport system component